MALYKCVYYYYYYYVVFKHRCSLLLQMSHIVWSVCLFVCLLLTRMCSAKTAELIEMSFWGLTRVGPGNHVLCGVEVGRIHSLPRWLTSWSAAFCQNSLTTCYYHQCSQQFCDYSHIERAKHLFSVESANFPV